MTMLQLFREAFRDSGLSRAEFNRRIAARAYEQIEWLNMRDGSNATVRYPDSPDVSPWPADRGIE